MKAILYRSIGGIAAFALLSGAALMAAAPVAEAQAAPPAAQPAAQPAAPAAKPGKNYKDAAEYNMYKAAGDDIGAKNFAKAITDVDAWKQKYPTSDYQNEREIMYIQAYAGLNQFDKVVDTAGPLLDQDLDTVFNDPNAGPGQVITLLYNTVVAIMRVQNPTPAELDIGKKAAMLLRDFNRKPGAVSDADWNKARTEQLQPPAKAALMFIATLPGTQAMAKTPPDCAAADAAFTAALKENPDSAAIAYNLGRAYYCEKKLSEAVYEFERAAVTDPTLGDPKTDAKKITSFSDGAYTKLHGSDEGLADLKAAVKNSPMPPDGFKIKTATEIANEKEAEFEKSNPQLALWMKIKAALADTNGDDYFNNQLKGAAVPQLKGTLVDAKPACRSKELLIAVPLPDAQQPLQAEITLKLDAPLTGKPELNAEIQFEGVPSAFTKDPFMLSLDGEKAKVEGLKTTPCAPAAHPPVKKK
jgi:tetratricopeptide (TPR) repeat protein